MKLFKMGVNRGAEGEKGDQELNGRKEGVNGNIDRANVEKFFLAVEMDADLNTKTFGSVFEPVIPVFLLLNSFGYSGRENLCILKINSA